MTKKSAQRWISRTSLSHCDPRRSEQISLKWKILAPRNLRFPLKINNTRFNIVYMDREVTHRDIKAIGNHKHPKRTRFKCELMQRSEDFSFMVLFNGHTRRLAIHCPLFDTVVTPQCVETVSLLLSLVDSVRLNKEK